MIKVGDTVKVIDKANVADDVGKRELYPIGTICKVMETEKTSDGFCHRIVKLEGSLYSNEYSGWWYTEKELEKGHLKWVAE